MGRYKEIYVERSFFAQGIRGNLFQLQKSYTQYEEDHSIQLFSLNKSHELAAI